MVAGVFVLAAPVAALAAGGVGVASHLKSKQLRQEKERLYTEALKKHEARKRRPSAGTTQGVSRPALAATIMTEDAKTERDKTRCASFISLSRRSPHTNTSHSAAAHCSRKKDTAGSPCGAYIDPPCKFAACRASILCF